MKTTAFLLIASLTLVFFGCATQQSVETKEEKPAAAKSSSAKPLAEQAKDAAALMVSYYNAGTYEKVAGLYNKKMLDALSAEKTAAILGQFKSQAGNIKNIGEQRSVLAETFDFPLDFEKPQVKLLLRISLDESGFIQGFWLLPFAPQVKFPKITAETKVEDIIKPYIEAKENHAVVAVVIENGQPAYYKFVNSKSGEALPDEHTLFEIGSITKVFTTTILSQFVEKKIAALDDPVSKFLPDTVKMPLFGTRAITLLDLATHTSGLPRLPSNLLTGKENPLNPYALYKVDDLYSFLNSYKLTVEPGKKAEYSNLGVGLLGLALARKDGSDYETLLKKYILKPLGMDETVITLGDTDKKRMAQGHDATGNAVPNWDIPVFEGAGAIKSNAADLVKFLMAQTGTADAGELGAAIKKSHEPKITDDKLGDICLGWLETKSKTGDTFIWHNGGTGGFRSFIGFWKDKKSGVIVLSNSANDVDLVGRLLLDYLNARVK